MTEKRFTKVEIRFNEFGIADNGSLMASYEVINTLNEQHEEIKELQRHLDIMRSGALTDDKRIKELYKENEQLKKEIKALNDFIILEPLGDVE